VAEHEQEHALFIINEHPRIVLSKKEKRDNLRLKLQKYYAK
jgi:hypothetical protein